MIEYSFMGKYSKNTKEEARGLLENTDKPIKYTYGLKYRHPSTYMVDVDREKALEVFGEHWCDVTEHESYVDLNAFSSNDLW